MSNDTPSWSGDDDGSVPPPAPPGSSSPPPSSGAAPGASSGSWSAGTTAAKAGLAKRFAARVVDGLIVGIPLGLLLIFGMGLDASGPTYSVLTAVVNLAYFVFLESSQGGTLGKRLLGLSVAATGGGHVSVEQAFKRNWWLLLGIVPVIGPLASLGVTIYIAATITSDDQNRGFHDKMADALVLDR